MGEIECVENALTACDVVLMATQSCLGEGSSAILSESMACGTPVVTTKLASLPEVAGEAGYYIDPEDEKSLFAAFEAFENNSPLIQDLPSRGLKQAAKFTWKKCAIETLEFYQNCLKS